MDHLKNFAPIDFSPLDQYRYDLNPDLTIKEDRDLLPNLLPIGLRH